MAGTLGRVMRSTGVTGLGRFAGPLVFVALAVPLLNPVAPGPSAQAVPLLLGGLGIAALVAAFYRSCFGVVAAAWVAVALVSALFGLLQYFGLTQYLGVWISAAEVGEAHGNLRQRNLLATLTNIGVALLVWRLTRESQRRSPPLAASGHVAVALALALLVSGNAATASRVGLLQLILVVALAACWPSRSRRPSAAVGMAVMTAYVMAAVVLPWLLMLTQDVEGSNVFTRLVRPQGCESRQILWMNVLQLISKEPWTGWGWGQLDFAHYATLYEGERFCAILDNAHNLPLHLAVELGVPVALLACGGIVWLVLRARPWREVEPVRQLAWTVLGIIGLHSLVEYPLWYAPFFTAAALCVVFLAAPPQRGEAWSLPRWLTASRWLLALALTVTVLHAWRDYQLVSQLYVPSEQRSDAMRRQPERELANLVWFCDTRDFAFLTTRPLTAANAEATSALASRLLHFSPEPRVIEVLIESLMLQGREDEALWHLARFRAAFPSEFRAWRTGNKAPRATGLAPASVRAEAS